MTNSQALTLLRMLLDDSRDWYPTLTMVKASINTAQNRLLHKYYKEQNERALRPFYAETTWITDLTLISDILYPRSCKMRYNANLIPQSHEIAYLEPNLYFNYFPYGDDRSDLFPRAMYYTIYGDTINNVSGKYFTARTIKAMPGDTPLFKLWYIKEPAVWNFDQAGLSPLNNVSLEFPSEFHVELITMAAEILNDIDVGEQERGGVAQGRLTLEGVGGG